MFKNARILNLNLFFMLVIAMFLAGVPDNVEAGMRKTCEGSTQQRKIDNCTRLIVSGELKSNKRQLAEAYNIRGRAYFGKGDYASALEDFNHALKLNPKFADAYYNRGLSYKNTGKYREALADYQENCKLASPEEVKTWQRAYKALGQYTGAIDGICGPATINAFKSCAKTNCWF